MSGERDPRLTRRAFLAIIAAAGASACSGAVTVERSPDSAPRSAAPRPTATRPGSPSPAASGAPSEAAAFEPIAGETYPNAKRVAGRFVQSLLTYDETMQRRRHLRRLARHADETFDVRAVARRAQPVLVAGAVSRGEVIYPQLGGLTVGSGTDRASVMVVVAQHLLQDRGASTVTRTMDVRLIRRGDQWRVEDLADAGGAPVQPAKGLPDLATKVLEDGRIEMADSARWDILSGETDKRLLQVMLDLAGVAPYAVAVLKSGHPRNVFGTDLISGHTLGRGVDIWRIDGRPVVLQGSSTKSAAHGFTARALNDFDVPELGSPWDLDGPPEPGETKPSFTDAVHADHIHIAFKAP